jgi:hypothetical protein
VKKLLVDVGKTAIKKPYPTVCCRDGKNFPSRQKWRARVEMHPANFTEAAISMDGTVGLRRSQVLMVHQLMAISWLPSVGCHQLIALVGCIGWR